MKETMYIMKMDKQNRLSISSEMREIFGFKDMVYIKLHIENDIKYIQIAGYKMDFYHCSAKIGQKGRFIVPKEVREKFELYPDVKFVVYEDENDIARRSLYLRLST